MKLGIREMLIGTTAWSYSSALSYKGSMSNIRIYNRVLSDQEVKNLYDTKL
jgi:hypothetical protein